MEENSEVSEPLRIAFVGRKMAGKTYAAHYLYKHHNFKTMKLQDSVKKVIKWFYQYRSHERVSWEKRLEFYDALYALDNDIHVDYLLRRISQLSTRDIVVDDPRYINEVQKLRDAGFVIIRIAMNDGKRNRLVGMKTASPGTVKLNEYFNRTFEAYQTDYTVLNDTKEGLYRLLDSILEKELTKRGR